MAVYGYDPSTGRLVIYIYIDHGLLTKHHSEYIMIEEVTGGEYRVHLMDCSHETRAPNYTLIVERIKTLIESKRETKPTKEVISNFLPSYLTDKRLI